VQPQALDSLYRQYLNMDAIFIQSFDKEIINKKLERLIARIFENLDNKRTKIFVFLNIQSISIIDKLKLPPKCNIGFIYVDEENVTNPTTRIFQFLINYKIDEFKKILLLESDCFLLKGFDKKLIEFEGSINKPWYIIGSTYYGNMPWMNDEKYASERKNHMNGVAIYNRSKDFINFINYIFISNEMERDHTNYDFAMHIYSPSFGIRSEYIDCPYILNISNGTYDTNLTHHELKPDAVVIHTKNETYYT
jgi:hypothetical protein